MREFAASQSRASALPLPAKILYTAFAALTLCGLFTSVALYDAFVVFTAHSTPADLYARLIEHYRGGSQPFGRPPLDDHALLEVTHAHLFSTSVLLLVAGHLFLLTSASARTKSWWVGTGVAAVVLHVAAPWIIVLTDGRGGSGLLYPISGAGMLVSLGVMTGLPVWEMWRRAS